MKQNSFNILLLEDITGIFNSWYGRKIVSDNIIYTSYFLIWFIEKVFTYCNVCL